MKTNQTAMALLISILITIISVSPDLAQSANQQKNLSVEGEWELISTNTTAIRKDIGQRLSISRQGDGYEVKWLDGRSAVTYSGNDTRIVHTFLEDLGKGGGSEGGPPIPASVLQQVTGQKAPINKSYTLSGDGLVLQGECDIFWFYWWKKTGRFERYEIAPGYSKTTFKRVSGPAVAPKASPAPAPPTIAAAPAKKTATSAVAQVEAWGEYYFLTKDGRKLTGAEAGKVPLEEGGKVVTGKAGHVRLTLPDDTTWTVGPNSDLVIDPFVYDADKTPQQVMVDMTKGVFRWVTGKTAPQYKPQMQVTLPVVAVGIRGTDFEAAVAPNGRGRVALYAGQLEITETESGFTFLLNAGQMVTFSPDGKVSRPKKIKGAKALEDE